MFLVVYLQTLGHGSFWRTLIYHHPKTCKVHPGMTGHGELYSASAIVRDLMLCAEATTQMRVDALKGQAGGCKEKGQSCVAENMTVCNRCQFHDP